MPQSLGYGAAPVCQVSSIIVTPVVALRRRIQSFSDYEESLNNPKDPTKAKIYKLGE